MKAHRKCCHIRMILAVVVFAAISWGCCMVAYNLFPGVFQTETMKLIIRPQESSQWKFMPLAYLVQAIIFICLYMCLGRALTCCKCPSMRGAFFGIKVWLIAGVANCMFWFISENVTLEFVMVILLSQFLAFVLGGAIAGKIIGNPWCGDLEGDSCPTSDNSCGMNKNHCGGKNHCAAKE